MTLNSLRPGCRALQNLRRAQLRSYSHASTPLTSPFAPRHLLSIADLTPAELTTLVRSAHSHKAALKSGAVPTSLLNSLTGKVIAMPFSKRSTRTRVSTESAVTTMGGHPMFLGSGDIQLGVNESLYDTSVVISSMTAGIVARVGPHSDVAGLAKWSSVPVINALSDEYHPLQTIADYLTIHEAFPSQTSRSLSQITPSLEYMRKIILSAATTTDTPGTLSEVSVPEEAIKDADVLVTDTWISMGQEEESAKRLKAFAGYQITEEMAKERHQDEVNDAVFYGPRSLVFPEAENRVYSAISALEAFVVKKGKIV
ncbi:hypothetical protein DID88_000867 [Monilinia fructigena]|uniref:Ornithine carbamoyltransferase, mitochondrial n=1 Tax=Monilinia fructigena TaxID=38457 RepID=A0A395J3T5_9HELO|nr:hypothetical protein DID88_000867 [Monilinia fructigena]